MRNPHGDTFSGETSQEITARCVDADGRTRTLELRLGYSPEDPYAVTVTFRTEWGDVIWTMARELLSRGLTNPTGEGDVHVWPCLDPQGNAVVIIELSSPDGELLVQVRTRDLTRFVERTFARVPAGAESDHIDVDLLISQLLHA